MGRVAKFLVDSLLWCWTADGLDPDGNAVRDGVKYDLHHQRHTDAALTTWNSSQQRGAGLTHEHAVPKKLLVRYLLTIDEATPNGVHEFLTKFCLAVIVTRKEDGDLNKKGLRESMPANWAFSAEAADPLARYRACELLVRSPLS